MIYFLISILLGAIPDVLYYYLWLKNIKEIKDKKFLLFLIILIGYVVIFMILRYNLYLYLIFYLYIYFGLKVLYKSKINDFFLMLFIDVYYILISILCFFLIPNYAIALILNKILLFMPLIFKNKVIKMYKSYCKMWNRNREVKQPIKSLTLRNISLVILNLVITISDILLIYLSLINS